MFDLEYSNDALNVRSAFFDAEITMYVEGDDDVLFWEIIIPTELKNKVHIEPLGGSQEVDRYIKKIEKNEINAIAARDSDFTFRQSTQTHKRIIYTAGYSIENTIYTAETIHQTVRAWCKASSINSKQTIDWLKSLETSLYDLIHYDIANEVYNKGISIMPDNCTKLMEDQKSPHPCIVKISSHIKNISPHFKPSEINKCKSIIPKGRKLTDFMRGHFLASAVLKYIAATATQLNRKITISADSLYAASISQFSRLWGESHPHFHHYDKQIREALS